MSDILFCLNVLRCVSPIVAPVTVYNFNLTSFDYDTDWLLQEIFVLFKLNYENNS